MQLENLNVESQEMLITPEQLKRRLPVPGPIREALNRHRHTVRQIVAKNDKRLLVVVGPCSIHDPVKSPATGQSEHRCEGQPKIRRIGYRRMRGLDGNRGYVT